MSRAIPIFPWHVAGTLVLLGATLAASKLTAHRRSDILAQPLDTISREIRGFVGSENPALSASPARAKMFELPVANLCQAGH